MMVTFTREFFRKAGRKGGKRQKANSTPEDLAKWGRAGALKRWANKKKGEKNAH